MMVSCSQFYVNNIENRTPENFFSIVKTEKGGPNMNDEGGIQRKGDTMKEKN